MRTGPEVPAAGDQRPVLAVGVRSPKTAGNGTFSNAVAPRFQERVRMDREAQGPEGRTRTMRGWAVSGRGGAPGRLVSLERETPVPGPGEVLVRVLACGVCRTDLHLADGDLAPHAPLRIPGHEVVGEVIASGPGSSRFTTGDRVGIAWLRETCGSC